MAPGLAGEDASPVKLTTLVAAVCAAATLLPAAAHAAAPAYYLSLGDSLAVGVQPDAAGKNQTTLNGYDQKLALSLSRAVPGLKHVSLGCGGATSASLIAGKQACDPAMSRRYKNTSAKSSQLAWAERFLKRNRAKVKLVTVTVGANDLLRCVNLAAGTLDAPCLQTALTKVAGNLSTIAKRLRKAGGANVTMVASTYYNPLLAGLLKSDPLSQTLAKTSIDIIENQVNAGIRKSFGAQGFKIAEVGEAFKINTPLDQTVTVPGLGAVPVAIATTCQTTYMCAPAPTGPNIHATNAGYALMAQAFAAAAGLA